MAHTASARNEGALTPVVLILAVAVGFALGQNWQIGTPAPNAQIQPLDEDWHGNVRRSHWPNGAD